MADKLEGSCLCGSEYDPSSQFSWLQTTRTRNNKAVTFSDNGFGTRESCDTLTFEVDLLDGAGQLR